MKHSSNVFVILLILGLVAMCTAGCISLGKTVSEINVGNQTVGSVSFTPTDNLLSPDASAERFNVDFNLLDNKDLINNLTDADKTELLKLLTGNASINLDTFVDTTEDPNKGTDFWIQIMNIKLSSNSNKTLSESLKTPSLDDDLNSAMDALNKFLDDFKL